MQWTDTAIILSSRRFGESGAVTRLLTRGHGLHAGVVRGATAKAHRGTIHPGNIVNATWNARLPEQLGTLRCELLTPHAAYIMPDPERLSVLAAVCALVEQALPERHPYPRLHEAMLAFLELLRESSRWREAHVRLELEVLAEAGFGLDLSECAATGTTADLIYVSPKSGRAVCAEAGAPYRDRLLPLPAFLRQDVRGNHVEIPQILAGLALTGYFLEHWLLAPYQRRLPAARLRYLQSLTRAGQHPQP